MTEISQGGRLPGLREFGGVEAGGWWLAVLTSKRVTASDLISKALAVAYGRWEYVRCGGTRGRMGDGFRVDLDALTRASDGVRDTVEAMARKKVADIDCPADAFGHDRLSDVVCDFCDRWDVSVVNLSDDGAEIASRLSHSVEVYRRTDEAARVHFHGLLVRPDGEDPAAE